MSKLIHCDGPGCDQTKDATVGVVVRQLCEPDWLTLERDGVRLDFHDDRCLANWTTGKPRATTDRGDRPCLCTPHANHTVAQHNGGTDDQPCTCHAAKDRPHTKAQHQAYPTVVDGR